MNRTGKAMDTKWSSGFHGLGRGKNEGKKKH